MAFNYSKLLGKIKEVCGTQAVFAAEIGLSERSLSQKLNGKRMWKQLEILKACEVLRIEFNEISLYFFTLKVQSNELLV